MQNYKEGGGPPPPQSPGRGPAAPISMTMSLNGPPGYHMHPSVPAACLPRPEPGATAREGSARAQHEMYLSGAPAPASSSSSSSSRAKHGGAVSSGGGGGGHHGYRAQDPHHMTPQSHLQSLHPQQHPQHLQQPHATMHHRGAAAAAGAGPTAQHPGHHAYPAPHHHHHQQQQQHHHQQQAQPSPHHSLQAMQMAGMTQAKKDARPNPMGTSGVFKTPSSSASAGYPAQPNGLPGIHPQQYPGYPMMGDASSARGAEMARMDLSSSSSSSSKHRSSSGGSMSVSQPATAGGYRMASDDSAIDSSRTHHLLSQRSAGHMSQQQQQHHHQQQQQQMMMTHSQHMQQKGQEAYMASAMGSHHSQQKAGGTAGHPHPQHPHPHHPTHQHFPHPHHTHSIAQPSSSRSGLTSSSSSSTSRSPAAVVVGASGYGSVSPQVNVSPHMSAGHSGLATAHHLMSPSAKDPARYPQHPHHHPNPHHGQLAQSPATDYNRWPSASASVSSVATMPRRVSSDVTKHMSGEAAARSIMRSQPPVGSIQTGEPRVQHVGEGSHHGRHGNPPMLLESGAGLAPPAVMGKGSIQLGTPAVKPGLAPAETKMDASAKSAAPSGANGVPLDLSRPEPARPGDAPLDLSVKARKRSAGEVSPAIGERGDVMMHSTLKKPRHELHDLTSSKVGVEAFPGQYHSGAERGAAEWPQHALPHVQAKSGVRAPAKKDIVTGMAGQVPPPAPLHHSYPHHAGIPAMAAAYGPESVGQSQVSRASPKVPHAYPPGPEQNHGRSSGSSSGGGGSTSSQPRTHSIEMSFEGKVDDMGAKQVKGLPAPLSSLHSQVERVQHAPLQGQSQMKSRHMPQAQPYPHREAAGYRDAVPRVSMTEEQMHKAMQQQQQQFQRHQQHSYPPKSVSSSSPSASQRSHGHHTTGTVRGGQESSAAHQQHALMAQTTQQYVQQKYNQQLQQQQTQYQQQQTLQRQQQKQQQEHQQQQHRHHHMQVMQEQQKQQRQLQAQARLQYDAHAHHHAQYVTDPKREGHQSMATQDRRYAGHEPYQQDEVRKSKMPAPTSRSELHSEDRLSVSWHPQQHHQLARASPVRVGSGDTMEAYAVKIREQVQPSIEKSGTPPVALPAREQRKPPQQCGAMTGKAEDVKSSGAFPFSPNPVARSPVHSSSAQFAANQALALDRPAPPTPIKPAEGGRLKDESPLGKPGPVPAPSPVSADSRPRSNSGAARSRPPSAARSEGNVLEASAPGMDEIPSTDSAGGSGGEVSFQRPQPVAGTSCKVGPRGDDMVTEMPSTECKEEKASAKASTEEFLSPLSIAIPPSSPSVGPASVPRPASPAPPPPPPSSSGKIWSRKRMILNAVNQDETLKKYIGGAGGSPGIVPGPKPDYQRLRQFSSSPTPSSPKMPILSPQEKGDSEVGSGQNDDPPELDPSAPDRSRPSARQTSNLVRGGVPAPASNTPSGSAGAGLSVTPSGPAGPAQDKQGQSFDSAAKPAATDTALGTTVAPESSLASADTVVETEAGLDKGESGLPSRRCSGSSADLDRSSDPAGQGQGTQGQGQIRPRPPGEGIRRNSLDRPWGYQKNIPVANVAPFMHSKSAGGGVDMAGREGMDTSLPPAPVEALGPVSDQPKSEDVKPHDAKLLMPEEGREEKPRSPSPRQEKARHRSEKRKRLTAKSKSLAGGSSSLLKKLERIKNSKPRSPRKAKSDLEAHSLAISAYHVRKGSDYEQIEEDLEEIASTLRRKKVKGSGGSADRQKRSKQRSQQSSAERPKAGATSQGSDADTVEADTDTAAGAMEKTPDSNSKKDLALSREERAKRRALIRGKEEELEKKKSRMNKKRPRSRTQRRRLSSTNQKARELKRTALGRRPRREAAKRKSGQYNRNAAYEEEVRRDESRKAIRRARRHASNLARERLQQQHRHGHNNNPDDDDDEEDDDIYDDDDDNSQDDAEHLPVGDEPWDITAHGHGHGSRQSRKSNRPARKDGASGKTRPVAGDTSEPEEYFDDADDESKDISEDDDGEETEVGEGGSSSAAAPSRGKGRSSLLRKKRHGKLRPIRRRLLDPAFGEDTLDGLRQEVLYPEGEEVCDVTAGSALPVPPEVKRIAVNKNSGETLLHRAARLGNEEVTLYCLRSGEYQVNARDNAGYTALHESCVKGSVKVARHLIERGADVNCCSQDGIRPLHDAVENDHAEVVRLLLSSGADPLIATYGGKTPLKIARTTLMFDLIKGYLGDLNGYDSEEERLWTMPGSYTLHSGTDNPDNGFDIFVEPPTDDDDVDNMDAKIEEIFDDDITAPVPTYQVPPENLDSNAQTVVLQDDLLRQLRIPHKHVSSLLPGLRAHLLHISGSPLQDMLQRCVVHRAGHTSLQDSEKVSVIPLAALRKMIGTLEQLYRRATSKGSLTIASSSSSTASSSSSSLSILELQADSEASLIRHLGEMSLTHDEEDEEGREGKDKHKAKMVTTMAKVGVCKVLGERVPSLPLLPSGDKPWIKTEKSLIAPSSLSKHFSHPLTHPRPHQPQGLSHSPSPQFFPRNPSSQKLGLSQSSCQPTMSSSFSSSPLSSSLGFDKTFMSRSGSDSSASTRRYFSGLFPSSGSSLDSSIMGGNKLAGSSSSSALNNPFKALATFTSSKFSRPCFKAQTKVKTEPPGENELGDMMSSSLPSSSGHSSAFGRSQASSQSSHHGPKCNRFGGEAPAGNVTGTFFSRGGVQNTSSNTMDPVLAGRSGHPTRTIPATDRQGSFRRSGVLTSRSEESSVFQTAEVPAGGGSLRPFKRSGVCPPTSLPSSKSVPPGWNPSVVIKTSGPALSTAGGVVIRSSSQSMAPSSPSSSNAGLGNMVSAPHPKVEGMQGGYTSARPGPDHQAWKTGFHKGRWSTMGAKTSSSTMTSSNNKSSAADQEGGAGRWSCRPHASHQSTMLSSSFSSFVKDSGKEIMKSTSWPGGKDSMMRVHGHGHTGGGPSLHGSSVSPSSPSLSASSTFPSSSRILAASSSSMPTSLSQMSGDKGCSKSYNVRDSSNNRTVIPWFSQRSAGPNLPSNPSQPSHSRSTITSSSSAPSFSSASSSSMGREAQQQPFSSSKSSSLSSLSSKHRGESGAQPDSGGRCSVSTKAGGMSTQPGSNGGSASSEGGGTKGRSGEPQWDFDQMFSDESSSNSFTTVVDNLDYDNSLSPATSSAPVSGTSTSSSSSSSTPSSSHNRPHGKDGAGPYSGGNGKGFGVGVFSGMAAGKDRNGNEIGRFTPKS